MIILKSLSLEHLIAMENRYIPTPISKEAYSAMLMDELNDAALDMEIDIGMDEDERARRIGLWTAFLHPNDFGQSELMAFTWSHLFHSCPGESSVDVDRWHEAFINDYQNRLGYHQIDLKAETETLHTTLQNLATAGTPGKMPIFVNNFKRDWLICWLYILAADQALINELRNGASESGNHLMFKVLTLTRLASQQNKRDAMIGLIQYLEAVAIGHLFHLRITHTLLEGFRLMCKLSPQIGVEYRCQYSSWCVCKCHGQSKKIDRQMVDNPLLFMNYQCSWNENNGIFYTEPDCNAVCSECGSFDSIRRFVVDNAMNETFGIRFRFGVPKKLWAAINENNLVRIGHHVRRVRRAIFEFEINTFAAGFQVRNRNRIIQWWICDSVDEQLHPINSVSAREQCRIIICETPSTCNICNRNCSIQDEICQCPICGEELHTECFNDNVQNCQSVSCRSRRRRQL